MRTPVSKLLIHTAAVLFLSLSILSIHSATVSASTAQYTLGLLDGQNGWNGGENHGVIQPFNVTSPGAADVVGDEAHTGLQSWHFARGEPKHPGVGTPFSPIVTTAGAPNQDASGDMLVISFAFKAAQPGDGSIISIYEGANNRDDRTGSNIYLESNSSDSVHLYMFPAAEDAPYYGDPVDLGQYSAADWHVVEMTTIYPDTSVNPGEIATWGVTTYKVDGAEVGQGSSWMHWWRYKNGLDAGNPSAYPYAPGSSIKFSNNFNDDDHHGFYFDDVTFRVISSATHATVGAFSTGFENTDTGDPKIPSPPVSGTYTTSFNQIVVTFNQAINDPGGSNLPDDVTNPDNYLLFQAGQNGVYDTVECSTGIQGDDVPIGVDSVTYDNDLYQARLNINNSANLGLGNYRLLVCGTTSIVNTYGTPLNGEPGYDSRYDFTIGGGPVPPPASSSSSASALLSGFAPGLLTSLPHADVSYADLGTLWLEIPVLGVKEKIVGVPESATGWDVSWLGSDIGWLNGTAWPSWDGNSVLTAHVYGADGLPGPFINLASLKWGDKILLHSDDTIYVYEVRTNGEVGAGDIAAITRHEKLPWLTLVTCSGYDEASGSYRYREVVRAVLMQKE